MAQLSANYQQAHTALLNQYNDSIDSNTKKLLASTAAKDATGVLGTKLGLLQLQDDIDKVLNDNLNSQQFMATRMNMMSKIAMEQQTQTLALAKVDSTVSTGKNDGFAYNSNGNRIKDAQGNPTTWHTTMSDQEKMDQQFKQAKVLKQMELDQGHYVSNGFG